MESCTNFTEGAGVSVTGGLGDIREYGNYRDRIYYRVANTERNREHLKGVLHMEMLDLSVVFYALAWESGGGIASVPVGEGLLKLWGVTAGEAMAQAVKNTPLLFPVKAQPITAALEELWEEGHGGTQPGDMQPAPGQAGPYIMSNTKGLNGFSAALYPDALKDFSGVTGTDLYILPSSVHEAVLLPADSCIKLKELQDMVGEVNRTAVGPEDFLSDNVYYYDREKNELRIAGEETRCVKL